MFISGPPASFSERVPLKRGTCSSREHAKALGLVLVAPPSRVGRPSQVSKDTLFGFQHIAEQKNHLCNRLRRIACAKRSRRLWLSRFPTIFWLPPHFDGFVWGVQRTPRTFKSLLAAPHCTAQVDLRHLKQRYFLFHLEGPTESD